MYRAEYIIQSIIITDNLVSDLPAHIFTTSCVLVQLRAVPIMVYSDCSVYIVLHICMRVLLPACTVMVSDLLYSPYFHCNSIYCL